MKEIVRSAYVKSGQVYHPDLPGRLRQSSAAGRKRSVRDGAKNTLRRSLLGSSRLFRIFTVTYSLILCGHTHIPRSVEISSTCLIVNPGSVGLQAYDDEHPFFHKMEAGSPHARYAIL
ncbi:metallophosphoesterase family protein [Cronobacter turicensis]